MRYISEFFYLCEYILYYSSLSSIVTDTLRSTVFVFICDCVFAYLFDALSLLSSVNVLYLADKVADGFRFMMSCEHTAPLSVSHPISQIILIF